MIRTTARRGVLALGILFAALVVTVPLQAAERKFLHRPQRSSRTSPARPTASTRTSSTPGGCIAARPRRGGSPTTGRRLDAVHGGGTNASLVVTVARAGRPGLVFNGGDRLRRHDGTRAGAGAFPVRQRGGEDPRLEPERRRDARARRRTPAIHGAIYKGLAIAEPRPGSTRPTSTTPRSTCSTSSCSLVTTRAFIDPSLPAGFAPFGIQTIGGTIFVTYAKQDAEREDEVAGQGLGFVDVFDTAGNAARDASPQHGQLNAPWGLALAPPTSAASAATCSSATSATARSTPTSRSANGRSAPRRAPRGRTRSRSRSTASGRSSSATAATRRAANTLFFTAGPDDEDARPVRHDHGGLTPTCLRERRAPRPVSLARCGALPLRALHRLTSCDAC